MGTEVRLLLVGVLELLFELNVRFSERKIGKLRVEFHGTL